MEVEIEEYLDGGEEVGEEAVEGFVEGLLLGALDLYYVVDALMGWLDREWFLFGTGMRTLIEYCRRGLDLRTPCTTRSRAFHRWSRV